MEIDRYLLLFRVFLTFVATTPSRKFDQVGESGFEHEGFEFLDNFHFAGDILNS